MKFILFDNGKVEHTDKIAHDFELLCDGIFTTLRTSGNGLYILFFDKHFERLVNSYTTKFGKSIDNFDKIFHSALSSVLRLAREENQDCDFRVACLIDSKGQLTLHCSLLPPAPANPTLVRLTRHASRSDPSVKDLEWVRERQDMEKMIGNGVNEVIMADEEGFISEGLSSNCFIVCEETDGSRYVYTAPDDVVLHGTMRFAAIENANLMPYELKMEMANVNKKIIGVAVTSTSRGFLVAKKLLIDDSEIVLETEGLLKFSEDFQAALIEKYSSKFE